MTNRTIWLAVTAMFVLNGALFGIWASRIPAVTQALSLSHAQLGIGLLFLAAGAIVMFPLTGYAVDRYGAARVTKLLSYTYTVSLLFISGASNLPTLATALFLFGACHGAMDVAMNAWAAEAERQTGKSYMSSFHAMFSLGAGLGALSGYAAASLNLSVFWHFLGAGSAVALGCCWLGNIPWVSDKSADSTGSVFALPKGALAFVGLLAFCAALGEGAMADWSAVFLTDVTSATEGRAALGYAAFSVAMVAMRLLGGQLIQAVGPVSAARASGVISALGVGIAVGFATIQATLAGFVLMGFGYAVIMPLAFSRAANDPTIAPGKAIASVATLGYGGLLIGPPVIGFLAAATSLRAAFGLLFVLALLIVVLAPALQAGRELMREKA